MKASKIIFPLLFALVALTACMEEKYSECDFDVTFSNLTADGSDRITTTVLTLEFDRDIETLDIGNITLDAGSTGATAVELRSLGSGKYELTLNNIASRGEVTISISRNNYFISPASRTATVYYYTETPVTFDALSADGSRSETTTKLTLFFNQDINGLSAADLTLAAGTTGAVAGGLARIEQGKYELELSGIIQGGEVSLTVSKYGYGITPPSRTATIYYYTDTPVTFDALDADGSQRETTTRLTLSFSQDIDGLSAADITLTAGTTGAAAGNLTRIEQGKYELELSGITQGGEVSVKVEKNGYEITPPSRTATIYKAIPPDVSGLVRNATNNSPIEGATVMMRNGHNTTTGGYVNIGGSDLSVTTEADGSYIIGNISDGQYTLEFSKAGYISAYLNITVAGADITEQNVYLSEVLADNQYRVVLRWRTDRTIDLDTHLTGTLPNSSGFRVYYNSKTLSYGGSTIAVLDTDSRDTGPETITFTVPAGSTFVYWVYNFDKSPNLDECQPHIDIYKGSALIDSYDAADYPEADNTIRWKVFRIDDGGYTPLHVFDNENAPASGAI